MTKQTQWEGMRVYVVSLDGAQTPARLVEVLKDHVVVKYSHMKELLTYTRDMVVNEQDEELEYYGK